MRRITKIFCTLLGSALILTGCGPMLAGPFTSFDSNGARIYFTGTSANGVIRYRGGDFSPMAGRGMMGRGMMRGISLACADCHGADARGGRHVMHMQVMDAPDIRWSVLTASEAEGEAHDAVGGEHAMEHAPYTLESFGRAVREGVDPSGQPLDATMPRWQMADSDIADLVAFLEKQ